MQLAVTIDGVRHLGYERDGDGMVEIDVLVANEGVAASGQMKVGVVCDEEYAERCSDTLDMDPVPAGAAPAVRFP